MVLKLRIGVLKLRIDVLKLRIDVLKFRIDVLKLRTGVLKLRIDVLKLRIDVLKFRIGVLKLRIGVLKLRIDVLKLQIDDLGLRSDDISYYAATSYARMAGVRVGLWRPASVHQRARCRPGRILVALHAPASVLEGTQVVVARRNAREWIRGIVMLDEVVADTGLLALGEQ